MKNLIFAINAFKFVLHIYYKKNIENMGLQRKLIGQGNRNEIYEITMPNGDKIVLRTCNSKILDKTVKMWEQTKKAGLKTTSFLEPSSDRGKSVLLTESLDTNDSYYISPNTDNNTNNTKEWELSQNKIIEILNFKEFVVEMMKVAERAAKRSLSVFSDAYFYKIEKGKNRIKLDYVIADWENICETKYDSKLINGNKNFVLDSLYQFVNKYVDDNGSQKRRYLDEIENSRP
ncbi:MAG: hypothetical protein IJJ77_09790 [Paludibacteraceae bacterium]|nr:hypothetical protein [Paludibacteraceae bacterium]